MMQEKLPMKMLVLAPRSGYYRMGNAPAGLGVSALR